MYLTPQQVYKQYGYHPKSLAEWADESKISCIKSPGGHRRYPVAAIEGLTGKTRLTVLYARFSTASQKEDLKTQIEYLGNRYPGCECVNDIGENSDAGAET